MSGNPITFREEIIPAHSVKIMKDGQPPVTCPKCSGNHLVLSGNMSYPHQETWESGKRIDNSTNLETDNPFELLVIECLSCKVRFYIQSDENYLLSRSNSELKEKLGKLTGQESYKC